VGGITLGYAVILRCKFILTKTLSSIMVIDVSVFLFYFLLYSSLKNNLIINVMYNKSNSTKYKLRIAQSYIHFNKISIIINIIFIFRKTG